MKKYLLLIPTMFVMLLNVIGCGQVVFNASAAVDYSEYFHPADTLTYPTGLKYDFDLTDVDFFRYFVYSSNLSNPGVISDKGDYYFYSVYMTDKEYTKFINGESFSVCFVYFGIDSPDYESNSKNIFFYEPQGFCQYRNVTFNPDGSYNIGSISGTRSSLLYSKITGQFNYGYNTSLSLTSDDLNLGNHYFYQASNIPDFPFPDFVDYSGGSSSNKLNVDVHFKPTLSGKVDRLITDSNGDTSLANRMRFTLTNNSKFPIQYELFIVKKSSDFDVTAPYNDSYVFMYYSNSWVYAPNIDDISSWNAQLPQKQNKSSPWHYVSVGETVGTFFNYSQINLVESQDYTVYVTATRCDYDLASECVISPVEEIYSDMKQVHRAEIVFQSDFSMVHYSDVKYDPNDNSNGVIPFSSYEDIQKNHFSYNAKEDSDGKIDYNAKDVYSDKNSWWNNPSSGSGSSVSSGSSGSSASSNFNSLSRSFSNFFSFVNTTFNYFPSSYKLTISLGLTSIVILGLIKAVFR